MFTFQLSPIMEYHDFWSGAVEKSHEQQHRQGKCRSNVCAYQNWQKLNQSDNLASTLQDCVYDGVSAQCNRRHCGHPMVEPGSNSTDDNIRTGIYDISCSHRSFYSAKRVSPSRNEFKIGKVQTIKHNIILMTVSISGSRRTDTSFQQRPMGAIIHHAQLSSGSSCFRVWFQIGKKSRAFRKGKKIG